MSSTPSFHVVSAYDTDDPPPTYSFNIKVMVAVILALFFFLLLVLIINICARRFLRLSSSYGISRPNAARMNTGVDKAAIALMPTFTYKSSARADDVEAGEPVDDPAAAKLPLECAVCLNEFQDEETCRMLPPCKHIFHTECIDMWLSSHSTCPLCRAPAVDRAMEPSTEPASRNEQHAEGERQELAMEASPAAATSAQGNPVVSNTVEYPCNVLFWGDQRQVQELSQEPTSSTQPAASRSVRMPGLRALPQISIDIPPIEGNFLVTASGTLSGKEQEACSSPSLISPSLRASIKRILSRQSSRRRSFGQEGNEGSLQ